MYKEFYMNAILHNNVPENIINILKLMTGDMQIEKFLGFINPYLNKQPGDFLGYVRDEDSNEPLILLKT